MTGSVSNHFYHEENSLPRMLFINIPMNANIEFDMPDFLPSGVIIFSIARQDFDCRKLIGFEVSHMTILEYLLVVNGTLTVTVILRTLLN